MENRVVFSWVFASAKSLLIFALAGLAMFQVSQLWFVNITDRNFFLYMQARFAPLAADEQEAFARPFRIIYGAGDGVFNIRYSRIPETESWIFGAPTISEILTNGEFVAVHDVDQVDIDFLPVLIYEYPFAMCPEIFASTFIRRQRAGAAFLNHGVEQFYRIVIFPPQDENFPMLRAFFANNVYAWEFSLTNNYGRDIQIAPVATDALHYVPVTGRNIAFAPVVPPGFTYTPVTVVNPYENAFGALQLSFIRDRIEPFFNNPATINTRVAGDGVYTFSNLNTMVRYLVRDVLEYTSFRPIGSTASSTLISDFSAALAFIENDPYVKNEIFLAGYEPRGRERIFLFHYVIDDFPLVLTEWYTGPNCRDPLRAPIEVRVDHGRVVGYRRLAYNFILDEEIILYLDAGILPAERNMPLTLGFPIGGGPELTLDVFGG